MPRAKSPTKAAGEPSIILAQVTTLKILPIDGVPILPHGNHEKYQIEAHGNLFDGGPFECYIAISPDILAKLLKDLTALYVREPGIGIVK